MTEPRRMVTVAADDLEDALDMLGYVPEYFREKWGYVQLHRVRLQSVLDGEEPPMPTDPEPSALPVVAILVQEPGDDAGLWLYPDEDIEQIEHLRTTGYRMTEVVTHAAAQSAVAEARAVERAAIVAYLRSVGVAKHGSRATDLAHLIEHGLHLRGNPPRPDPLTAWDLMGFAQDALRAERPTTSGETP